MNVKVTGANELQKVLKKMPKQAESAVKKELKKIGQDLKGKSQRLAPVDTGDLRGSAYSVQAGMGLEVGFTEPYAIKQHEEVGYRHPKGGEAKFLETPFKANVNKYINAVKAAIDKAVG